MNRPPIRLCIWARGLDRCDAGLKAALERDAPHGLVCTFVSASGTADVSAHDALIVDASLPEVSTSSLRELRARVELQPILLWRDTPQRVSTSVVVVGSEALRGPWRAAYEAMSEAMGEVVEQEAPPLDDVSCVVAFELPDLASLRGSWLILPPLAQEDDPEAVVAALTPVIARVVGMTTRGGARSNESQPPRRSTFPARSGGAQSILQTRGASPTLLSARFDSQRSVEAKAGGPRRPRILVAGTLALIERLTEHGVEARALDPRFDAEVLSREAPDAIVMELGQAEASVLLARLRGEARLASLPILARCVDDDSVSQILALEGGADDAVPASTSDTELAIRLAARLARRRAQERLVPASAARLATERRMRDRFDDEVAIAERSLRPFTISVLAIDDAAPPTASGLSAPGASPALEDALAALSAELHTRIRRSDLLGRAGDELWLLLRECSSDATVQLLSGVAVSLQAAARERGHPSTLFTAGVAAYPDQGRSAEVLLESARGARTAAHERGESGVVRLGPSRVQDAVDPAKDGRSQRSIFVADPDPEVTRLLQYSLQRQGFSVEVFDDGAVLQKRLLEAPEPTLPDAVLFELHLPFVHGIELLRSLQSRSMRRRPKMILVTNRASDADIVRAFSLGCSDHVGKPFSVPVLVARIVARLREDAP